MKIGQTSTNLTVGKIIKCRSMDFLIAVLKNPAFIFLASAFVFVKVTSNLVLGASWINALRSGVLGLVLYVMGCFFISLLSSYWHNDGQNSGLRIFEAIPILLIIGLVLTLGVMEDTGNIAIQIPVWSQLDSGWAILTGKWIENSQFIEGTGLIGWPYLILYVVLPALVLWLKKAKAPRLFGLKTSFPALPFVAAYAIMFALNGISLKNLFTFIFVILWPGLGEEFFFRGILQGTFTTVLKNPVTAIVLTSGLFALSHLPALVFASSGTALLTLSALLSYMMMSFFWGYGYHRTGVLWPWIFIHAVSNLF
jgi:membrane protease YdiL (CAAX protease family)